MNKFDINFNNYASSLIHSQGKTISVVKTYFSEYKFKRIADVGCGTGHFGNSLIDQTAEIVFIDPSLNMLKKVKDLITERCDKQVKFINIAAETLNKNEHGTFDLILTRMALHHFKNASTAILQMCSCLNINGYLVISDLYASPNKALYNINQKIELLHDNTHCKNYTTEDVIKMVNNSGLKLNMVYREVILEKSDGISIENWCAISNSKKEEMEEINKILSSHSAKALEELGYLVSKTNEIINSVKTNLLIFKLQN